MTLLASRPTISEPHTLVFAVLAMVCLAVAVVPLWVTADVKKQRRAYWGGTFAACFSVIVASIPDWTTGVMLAVVGAVLMAFPAYFTSSLIEIRGKVYAFHFSDAEHAEMADHRADGRDEPPESPAANAPVLYAHDVTAAKNWWLMVGVVLIGVGNIAFSLLSGHIDWTTTAAGTALAIFALGFAYNDASGGFRVARGQYVQFTIIGIMTAGVFTALYLLAFAAGRRWPLRHRQSLEYRAHPRHQKKDS